jgi:2-oxoglutarate ferredoxin oxidoreductase subunit delta
MAEQSRGKVELDRQECKGCGVCVDSCPLKALELSADLNRYGVHPAQHKGELCSGCGICYFVCPEPGAITVYRLETHKSEVCDAAIV